MHAELAPYYNSLASCTVEFEPSYPVSRDLENEKLYPPVYMMNTYIQS